MAKYRFTANLVHRELDNFANGCDPDTGSTQFFGSDLEEVVIEAGSLFGLVVSIRDYFNVDMNAITLDSCEENGRIDIQTMTKGDQAVKCSYHRYATKFKAGECDLYLNNISGTVTEITPPALDLTAIWASENKSK